MREDKTGEGKQAVIRDKTYEDLYKENELLKQQISQLTSTQVLSSEKEDLDLQVKHIGLMSENAQEAIVVLQDEKHKYVNKKAAEIDGYPIEELIGKPLKEVIHPDDYCMLSQNHHKRLRGESVDKYRYRGIDTHGNIKWLEVVGTIVTWEKKPAVLYFITDVTAQVLAEEEAKRIRHQLYDIINFLPDATFAVDCAGKVIAWNRRIEKMSGIKASGMIGKNNYEYALPFYHERRPMLADLAYRPDKLIEKGYSYFKRFRNIIYAETLFEIKGQKRWLWETASLMYDHRANIIGAIESIRDVTNIKNNENEIREKSAILEQTNTALNVLLKHREKDLNEVEEKVVNNVKELILPYIDKLKSLRLNSDMASYVEIIEKHANEIISPFLMKLTYQYSKLTPREIQIASLVKDGKTTKEISEVLHVSVETVSKYRKRIRKKLHLKGKDENLRSHLLFLGNGEIAGP